MLSLMLNHLLFFYLKYSLPTLCVISFTQSEEEWIVGVNLNCSIGVSVLFHFLISKAPNSFLDLLHSSGNFTLMIINLQFHNHVAGRKYTDVVKGEKTGYFP